MELILWHSQRKRGANRENKPVPKAGETHFYSTISHKRAHFLGEWGGKLFMGKGIRRVGVKLANLLNRVPIPKKRTFSVEV